MEEILVENTDGAHLSDPTIPQGMAYRWLWNDDPLQTGPCIFSTAEQRYALATRQISFVRLLETAGPTMKAGRLDQENALRLAWIAPWMILLPLFLVRLFE